MVIATIEVANLQRKTERNEVGIPKSAGRSVKPMTQKYEGRFLPRRYFISSLFRIVADSTVVLAFRKEAPRRA